MDQQVYISCVFFGLLSGSFSVPVCLFDSVVTFSWLCYLSDERVRLFVFYFAFGRLGWLGVGILLL